MCELLGKPAKILAATMLTIVALQAEELESSVAIEGVSVARQSASTVVCVRAASSRAQLRGRLRNALVGPRRRLRRRRNREQRRRRNSP